MKQTTPTHPEPFPAVTFMKSVGQLRQAPPDEGAEIAFAGRSNAGKSSALNTLCGNKRLARTSKTPGRTQLLNFFQVAGGGRLVDLPGYGYARVSAGTRANWEALLDAYLRNRRSLRGLVLIMDIRHPLKPFDNQILQWCARARLPVHVLLTKSDKLSRGRAAQTLKEVSKKLGVTCPGASVQTFSAVTGAGLEEGRDLLLEWLGGDGT